MKYFRDLLLNLKQINDTLKDIRSLLSKNEQNTNRLAKCVKENHHLHGDSSSLSTKHWND